MKTEQQAETARLRRELAGHREATARHADRGEWYHVKMRADLAIKAEAAIVALKRGTPSDTPARGMRRVRVNG